MIRLALVEDDPDLLDDTAFALRDEGLQVFGCADGPALGQLLMAEHIHVVVLDIGLPGEDGLTIARRLRRERPGLGIIMLTARSAPRDRVQGMENGADMHMGKPVDVRELALVIRALARRLGVKNEPANPSLTLFVTENMLLTPAGGRIDLTPSETLVLSRLARATGRQASRRQIIEAFGSIYRDYDERRLEAIVSRLRKKLEAAGLPSDTLRAIRGVGYALHGSLEEHMGTTLPAEPEA